MAKCEARCVTGSEGTAGGGGLQWALVDGCFTWVSGDGGW